MFVAKITDGQIVDTGKLKDLFPNTSFSSSGPNDAWFTENNVKVISTYKTYDRSTQKLVAADPYLDGDIVYDVSVVDLSAEEIAEVAASADLKIATAHRARRNKLLAETDFYALSDVTMSAEMTTYRQALRDITSHENWPNLEEADWPTKPE